MPSSDIELPSQHTAIIAKGPGQLAIEHDATVPFLRPDMAIVRTAAVAINPVDAKMLDFSPAVGAAHGYDFAGTIVALGKDTPNHLAIGDRVAGLVHGMNSLDPRVGAFSEYVGACANLLLKLPDSMSFEEGASLGTGVATAALGLFQELKVPASLSSKADPNGPVPREGNFVLITGGSTATGTRAIQLLKIAGLRPIVTCSPSNYDLVYKFGAEKAFDYRSPTCAADIRAYTENSLYFALDCVSIEETTDICYKAIGRAGGRYVGLEPFLESIAATRPTIDPSWLMVLTIFGRKVALDGEFGRPAMPEHRKFGAKVFADVQRLLDQGRIEPHPIKVRPGGWEGVVESINLIRSQTFSGYKVVHTVS